MPGDMVAVLLCVGDLGLKRVSSFSHFFENRLRYYTKITTNFAKISQDLARFTNVDFWQSQKGTTCPKNVK
jgi:hypothetical protein